MQLPGFFQLRSQAPALGTHFRKALLCHAGVFRKQRIAMPPVGWLEGRDSQSDGLAIVRKRGLANFPEAFVEVLQSLASGPLQVPGVDAAALRIPGRVSCDFVD